MIPSPADASRSPDRPIPAAERGGRWWRRNPLVAGLATVGLVLLGALIGWSVAAVRFHGQRLRAESASAQARESERARAKELWQSYVDGARAGRLSRQVGQRFAGLDALERAAHIRPDLQLRNEAIACMALVDLRAVPGHTFPAGVKPAGPPARRGAVDPVTGRRARIRGRSVLVVGADGKPLLQLDHGVRVDLVMFSPDGRFLASVSPFSVYLWRIPEGRLHCELEHGCGAHHLEFSHAGDLLLTHAFDGISRLWDAGSGRLLVRSDDGVVLGPFSPDDRLLRHADQAWELARASECRVLHHSDLGNRRDSAQVMQGPWAAAFSRDDRLIATAGLDGVRVWETRTGRQLAMLPDSGAQIAVFHADGSLLVGGGTRTRPGAVLWRWPMRYQGDTVHLGPPQEIRSMALYRPGRPSKRMAVTDRGGRVAVSEPGLDRVVLFEKDLKKPPAVLPAAVNTSFVALRFDGKYLAACPYTDEQAVRVSIWDSSGRKIRELSSDGMGQVEFTPDGKWLVVGTTKAYRFYQTDTWQPGLTIRRQSNLPGPIAFSPDGSLMAIASTNHTVMIVDPATGKEHATFTPPEQKIISSLTFNHDGIQLAVTTENQSVFLWDVASIWMKLTQMGLADDLPSLSARRPEPIRSSLRRAVVHSPDVPTVKPVSPAPPPVQATPALLQRFTPVVTLKWRQAAPAEAVRELAERVGIGLHLLPRVGVEDEPARAIDLSLERVPAWNALHRLEEAAGLIDAPGDSTTLQLRGGKQPPAGTTAVRGPFRISVASLTRFNGLLPRDGAMQRSERLSLVVGVQTIPHPELLRLGALRIDEVEDDRGQISQPLVTAGLGPLAQAVATPTLSARTYFARFQPPRRANTSWKKVRGTLSVVVLTKRQELVRVADLATASGRTFTGADGTQVRVGQVLRQGTLWYVDLDVTSDPAKPLIEGRFRFECRDAADKMMLPVDAQAPLRDQVQAFPGALGLLSGTPGVGFASRVNWTVFAPTGLPSTGKRTGIQAFTIPAGHKAPVSLALVRFEPRTLEVPFEFRDLPLP
jgi:WD40 repeat protein